MSTTYYSTFHPAESSGTKGSAAFAGSALNTAVIYLYRRSATALTAGDKPNGSIIYTFDPPSINLTPPTLPPVTNGWTSTIPAGSDPLYAVIITVASDNPTVTITTGEWSTPVILAQNGAVGAAGANNAIAYLYQRSATSPAAPSGTFTYTFATGVLSGGTPGSWTQAIPATNGNPLWVIAATASASTATDTIASTEFSSPVTLAADGTNGTNGAAGLNSATVFLYKRSATTPTVPSQTTTYTFATAVLAGTLESWTQTVPAGTDPLYVTTATAAATTATDTILTAEWAAVRVLAQNGTNGTNGTNGAAGANNATVYLYQRSATSPAAPSGTFTYTFATGVLSGGTPGSWTQAIPATNGNPLWVIAATASASTATDTIASTEFSSPVTLVVDGAQGATGVSAPPTKALGTGGAAQFDPILLTAGQTVTVEAELYLNTGGVAGTCSLQVQWSVNAANSWTTMTNGSVTSSLPTSEAVELIIANATFTNTSGIDQMYDIRTTSTRQSRTVNQPPSYMRVK